MRAVIGAACVLAAAPLWAQQTPPRADSAARTARPDSVLRADSIARRDSIARADSVSTALPQADVPVLTEIGMSHRWNRDSLFSSGALTLADFLDRVPGLSSLRARYYMGAQVGSYNGDVGAVRLFLDGIELDAIDPRSGGVHDLTLFPLASLEELVVERGANELRLHMRSWRGPLRLTAQTRADVYTGDNRSNNFRGFWARRASNGLAVQAMLQQRSTDDRRLGGDGDATTIFTRIGYLRPGWSIDGTLVRARVAQQALEIVNVSSYLAAGRPIPRYDQVQRDAYLRFAAGNMERGSWLQLIAASRSVAENTPMRARDAAQGFAADSGDTTNTSTQIVATGGWATSRARLTITERLRLVNGRTLHQPSVRVGLDLGALTVSGFAERNPFAEFTRADIAARARLGARLALTGAVSYGTDGILSVRTDSTGTVGNLPLPTARAVRGEVAIRIGQLWFQGGAVVRDSALLRAPLLFDPTTLAIPDGRAIGGTYTVTGKVVPGIWVHLSGVRWNNSGWYRPQMETRSELTWRYNWRGASPTGGFDFALTGLAEYRSASFVPKLRNDGEVTALPTFAGVPLGLRAEFTIRDATISFQLRNLLGTPYTTIPGLLVPGALSVYGVRWTFWN